MSQSLLLAFVMFATVMFFTPGPNNIMLLSSGLTDESRALHTLVCRYGTVTQSPQHAPIFPAALFEVMLGPNEVSARQQSFDFKSPIGCDDGDPDEARPCRPKALFIAEYDDRRAGNWVPHGISDGSKQPARASSQENSKATRRMNWPKLICLVSQVCVVKPDSYKGPRRGKALHSEQARTEKRTRYKPSKPVWANW